MLVMATMRLRLTAYSLAGMQEPAHARQHHRQGMAYAKGVLTEATAELAAFYERIAVLVGRPMAHEVLLPVSVPAFSGLNGTTPAADASPEDVSAVVQVGAALGAAAADGDARSRTTTRTWSGSSPPGIIRTCSGCTSTCSTSARTRRPSPSPPPTWPSSAASPGGASEPSRGIWCLV